MLHRDYVREREEHDPEYKAARERMRPAFELGCSIIEARLSAGLTQQQLAEQIGTTQSAVARLESGRHTPTVEVLQRLSGALGVQFLVLPQAIEVQELNRRAVG